ncbi:tetratricopeptide repeat protein [Lentzea californiensis]|uniref:tetratricopeptide repeat protein n=1 Tax=Lentzea californiensis TaxID=438851 RepID=UPI002165AC82|nr:tetratricopeptide repeat protein [Lentzea californiensis]MCR3752628.1 Tetratricopeptide repeat-containing protein [Lentzea californiensis]
MNNELSVHDSTMFNAYQPNGEPAADRWVTAMRLFDADHVETPAERWERAQLLFESRDYVKAAELLAAVAGEVPFQTDLHLLLARAYYHSAQLNKAEAQLRVIVDRAPVEHYAHLLLGRTLERQGRPEEAAPWLRLAAAFGGELAEV